MNERTIFMQAVDIDAPAERAAFVEQACGGDEGLRRQVEGLLRSHADAGTFMDVPVLAELEGLGVAVGEGSRVGPYKLLEKIGEGGMGVVYMAEQERPVRRKVALKIIKPGMDSAQVIARFEAERQALAMMDHANIARVLDAGATEGGRPYFVMELVHGVPITRYCDENQLTVRERLELFVPVCRAIQHAHQKGIIHRDLKPSNVLVTHYDGAAVPKVIDFGVAKALHQALTDRTLFTNYGVLIGTFEYMAPEQAEFNALGVDTRSDVYSLGVLLYELLTGTTPLERERMRDAAFGELLRVIQQEEPPLPSVRLSTAGEALEAISARRRVEGPRLTRVVRGELDWIVMRCLEKDRSRRYETADALAVDVQRYLQDEPVSASPPSVRYKLRKFARRNTALIGVAGAMAAALIVGSGLAAAGFIDARKGRAEAVDAKALAEAREAEAKKSAEQARRSAEQARRAAAKAESVNRFLQRIFLSMRTGEARPDTTVRELLDEAAAALEMESASRSRETEAALHNALGIAYTSLSLYELAEPHLQKGLEIRRQTLGDRHPDVAQSYAGWGYWHQRRKDWAASEKAYRTALEIRKAVYGPDHPLVAASLVDLGFVLTRTNQTGTAEALGEEAEAIQRKRYGDESNAVASALLIQASALRVQKRLDEAEAAAREANEIYRKLRGPESVHLAVGLNTLGIILGAKKDPSAEKVFRDAIEIRRKLQGEKHPDLIVPLENLARCLDSLGQKERAAAARMERLHVKLALAEDQLASRPDDPRFLRQRADVHARLGDFRKAAPDLVRALELDGARHEHWMECALLHCFIGDMEAYRRYSRGMLERFKDDRAIIVERAAKICLFTPEISQQELALCTALSDRAVADGTPHNFYGWYLLTRGMAAYRAGQDAVALHWIGKANDWAKGTLSVKPYSTALLFSAMAHHRLGEKARAQRELAEATKLLEETFPKPALDDLNGWGEIIPLWIHLREAQGLILGAVEAG